MRAAWALHLVGAVGTIAVAVLVGVVSWTDSGPFALVLAAVPTVAVSPILFLTLRRRPAEVATWAGGVVVVAWGLLTGLGTGAYLLAPGAVVLLAALVSTSARQAADAGDVSVRPDGVAVQSSSGSRGRLSDGAGPERSADGGASGREPV